MRVRPENIKRKRRTSITKFDLEWNGKHSELQLFKQRFGHCNVPQHWQENTSLGRWVIRQRTYKEYLSPERVSQLKKLGFIWNLPDYWWNTRYKELVKFRKKYGHSDVSKGSESYLQLAEWVGKQRRDYKKKYSRLNQEKIQKLNELGFHWGVINTPWEQRYKELLEFKLHFGHCRVPQRWKENLPLASWVAIQRREHKNHRLNPNRFKQLDELGFLWKIKPRKKGQ